MKLRLMRKNKRKKEFSLLRQREIGMEGIDHRIVSVNGIKMHIAEKGQVPVVLFLLGFPKLWYS